VKYGNVDQFVCNFCKSATFYLNATRTKFPIHLFYCFELLNNIYYLSIKYRTDWEKFGHTLSEKIDLKLCLKTASDIDDAVNSLTNNIQWAVWESDDIDYYSFKLNLLILFKN